jgi:acyl-CoA thioesterase
VRTGADPRFSADTAVTAVSPGVFEADVRERWWVGRGPNGGYLAAIVLRALEATLADPGRAPRSLTVHFLAVPAAGPLRVECSVERAGRSLSTLSARMVQGETLIALALAAFSAPWPGLAYADAPMPDVTPPEHLARVEGGGAVPAFVQNFDMRWAIGPAPFSGADRSLAGGWLRLTEPEPVDAVAATAYMDAWIPAVFARTDGPVGAPTIDFTVHFRAALPLVAAEREAFHLVRFSSSTATEGFWEEDGQLWSADGTLLAQSRQLALVLPPRA